MTVFMLVGVCMCMCVCQERKLSFLTHTHTHTHTDQHKHRHVTTPKGAKRLLKMACNKVCMTARCVCGARLTRPDQTNLFYLHVYSYLTNKYK